MGAAYVCELCPSDPDLVLVHFSVVACHVFETSGLKRTKPEANVAAFRFEPLMHCCSLNKGLIPERCGGQVN